MADQLTLKQDDYPGFSMLAQCNDTGSQRQQQKMERCNDGRDSKCRGTGPLSRALKMEKAGHDPRNVAGLRKQKQEMALN